MDIKQFIGDYFGFNQEIKALESKLVKANFDKSALETQIAVVLATDLTNKAKIAELNVLLEKANADAKIENEIVSKRPQRWIGYAYWATDQQYSIDVRNWFQPFDDKLPIVSGANDEKALAGLRWVRNNFRYVGDDSVYGKGEYWAFPFQSLVRLQGDCEDGAILLANILVKSGVPYYRVRVCAGSVNGGGHAYCVYCRETDNQWVVLDWCYWPNDLPVAQRKKHKEEPNYCTPDGKYYVWFSWDLKHIYAEEKLPNVAKEFFTEK